MWVYCLFLVLFLFVFIYFFSKNIFVSINIPANVHTTWGLFILNFFNFILLNRHRRFSIICSSHQYRCNGENGNIALHFYDSSPTWIHRPKTKDSHAPWRQHRSSVFGLRVCWRVAALAPEVPHQVSSACTRSRSIHYHSSRRSYPERVFGRVRLHGPCVLPV